MKKYSLALVAGVLVGCGGGGSDTAPTTTTFPVESVLVRVATTAGNYGGNFSDSTGTYNLAISIAPGVDAQFASAAPVSKTFTTSTVLKKNGATMSTSSGTTYFSLNPLSEIGQRIGGDVINISGHTSIPATATVGSSGPFFAGTSSINAVFSPSQVTGTWSLEADTASTAFVCLNTRIDGSFVKTTEADCFKVDAAGSIVGFKATTTTNGRSTNANPVIDTFVFQ